MSILQFSGCDIERDVSLKKKYQAGTTGNAQFTVDSSRQSPTTDYDVYNTYSNNNSYLLIGSAPTTLIFQAWVLSEKSSMTFKFVNSSAQIVATLTIADTGIITFYRGDSATSLGASSAQFFDLTIWKYLSVKVLWDNAAGTVLVNWDNVEVLNLTGQNTNGSLANPEKVLCTQSTASGWAALDDWLFMDTAGSAPFNDLLSGHQIRHLIPTSDSQSQWTRSAGGVAYALLDEIPAASTDYVSSLTSGNIDKYVMQDFTFGVSDIAPIAVAATVYAKYDTGTPQIKVGADLSATVTTTTFTVDETTHGAMSCYMQEKPGTGTWTVSDINSLLFYLEYV